MTTVRPPRQQGQQGRRPAPEPSAPPRTVVIAVRKLFAAEAPEYFLLLGTTIFLVAFGLVMVLSSSSIEQRAAGGDFFAQASRQGLYALVGLPAMMLAARAPAAFWKRWAGIAVLIGIALQLLVFTGLGFDRGQNRNWINLGSFTAQPSELIKLALIVWLAWVLSRKGEALHEWKQVFIPIAPVAGVAIALVLAGNDLGTVIILLGIVFGSLFYAGVRLRVIAAALALVSVIGLIAVRLSDSRSNRVDAWLSGCSDPDLYSSDCWQTVHGWEALAHGGILGVGLGNSSAKWSWLPEADNDFIFAIIGEELGLLGAILVLGLFVVLAICFIRIIRMNRDPFAKIAVSAAMVWIVGQAFVNIAVVLGLLPVLGVPLPLVSAGGSALITTLTAIGVVLSFARHRPAAAAMAPRPPISSRSVTQR
jgi:cell division protein FtsW